MKILRRLLPFARPLHHFLPEYIIYTLLGILFGLLNFTLLIPIMQLLFKDEVVAVAMKPNFAFSVGYFIDLFRYYLSTLINNPAYGKFWALFFVCVIIFVSIILANIFRYLAVRVILRLRLRLMQRVRNKLYQKYLQQSLQYHHNHPKSDAIMVMTAEVAEIEGSIINALQVLLRDPFVVIASFGVLFYYSPQLTLFTIIFLPITGFIISVLTRKLKKLNYFSQEMMGKILNQTEESLSGIKQVQSFTAEQMMENRFNETNNIFSKISKKLFGKKELASPISEVLGVIAALTLVCFGGYLIFNGGGDLTGPEFISYIAVYTQIIQPLKNISQTTTSLQRGIVACEKIFTVLDEPITIKNAEQPVEKKSFNNGINISNLRFRYAQKDVLTNINLDIPKGKIIALVGQSGSGKSTLVDLIARFYDIQQGAITIDGTNIKEIDITDLRNLIGVVTQDNFLFNDTIFNNIAFGSDNVTNEQVIAAAKVANAHEFITQMENGYNTVTGERGVKLSGGQRQRISIARAVLKNAPILILDEATSALDTESERLVQDAINNMMQNRTSIVIAHRLSTVRHADEIIVLHQGNIVERGNHEQLIVAKGYYKKLVDLQEVK
jgi:ATP-binding cassette, subfamily B, bacterial MsbA